MLWLVGTTRPAWRPLKTTDEKIIWLRELPRSDDSRQKLFRKCTYAFAKSSKALSPGLEPFKQPLHPLLGIDAPRNKQTSLQDSHFSMLRTARTQCEDRLVREKPPPSAASAPLESAPATRPGEAARWVSEKQTQNNSSSSWTASRRGGRSPDKGGGGTSHRGIPWASLWCGIDPDR